MGRLTVQRQRTAFNLTALYLLLVEVGVLGSSWLTRQASPTTAWMLAVAGIGYGLATAVFVAVLLHRLLRSSQIKRHQLEQQVRGYQAFFEHHPDPMWVYDATNQFLDANAAAVHQYGYSKAEFLTMQVSDLVSIAEPLSEQAQIHLTKTKRQRAVAINSGEIRVDGEPAYWLIARDKTPPHPTKPTLNQNIPILQTIVDHIPVMLNFSDAEGRVLLVNREFKRVLGLTTRDTVTSDVMSAFYPDPEDRQQVIDFIHRADGSWRDFKTLVRGVWLDTAWCNIRLADGSRIGIGQDISERKQAEAALKTERDLLDGIVSTSVMAITVLNPQGKVLFANHQAETILGLSLNDLVKRTYNSPEWECTDLAGGEWSYAAQPFSRVMATGEPVFDVRHAIAWPNGDRRFISVNGAPIKNAQGDIVKLVFSISDITDQIAAEWEVRHLNEALEQQNRDLEALVAQRTTELFTFLNALSDDIFVIEAETMRVVFCNDSFAQSMGVATPTDIQDLTLYEYLSTESATYFAQQNQQVFDTGETLHVQEWLNLPSKSCYMDTYKIPLKRPNSEVYALIGSSRDITELMNARQTLIERTQQLETINHELDSFSYSVSHDLRAPLRHIGGFVGALRDELIKADLLPDSKQPNARATPLAEHAKTAHYLDVIETSSKKMGLLIDGLLTLSRIGRRPMERSQVDLQALAQGAIALIPANQTESVEFQVDPLPRVMGDAALLQQVFTNLIENAVKFSRDRHPAYIHIGTLADGTLFIQDNGVGFKMEYADQLFGAFQRLHAQHEFEGTGIGLAIVQRIIHRHGGAIWVTSRPMEGTTFYFTLRNNGTIV